MGKDKNKFYAIAEACVTLSVSAPTVEERDKFLDFARKWKRMARKAERSLAPLEDGEEIPAVKKTRRLFHGRRCHLTPRNAAISASGRRSHSPSMFIHLLHWMQP
jgi:hypothetical protein